MRNLKNLFTAGALSLSTAALFLTGCQSTPFSNRTDERAEGQIANDNRITSQVKSGLAQEPVYKFNDVGVKTFAGTVQLSGFVNTDQQKARAGQIAQNVPGVQRVDNNLSIKPELPSPTGREWRAPVIENNKENNAWPNNSDIYRRNNNNQPVGTGNNTNNAPVQTTK